MLISSAAIAAAATGELIYGDGPPKEKTARGVIGGFCILSCICSTAAFVAVPIVSESGKDSSVTSIWLFALTVVSGAAAIALVTKP